jgi:hypothetical protein
MPYLGCSVKISKLRRCYPVNYVMQSSLASNNVSSQLRSIYYVFKSPRYSRLVPRGSATGPAHSRSSPQPFQTNLNDTPLASGDLPKPNSVSRARLHTHTGSRYWPPRSPNLPRRVKPSLLSPTENMAAGARRDAPASLGLRHPPKSASINIRAASCDRLKNARTSSSERMQEFLEYNNVAPLLYRVPASSSAQYIFPIYCIHKFNNIIIIPLLRMRAPRIRRLPLHSWS